MIGFFFLLSLVSLCAGDQFEYDLYQKLMKTYNRLERPVVRNADPVTVHLGLILQQIVGVDEKNQIIEVNAWIKYTWKDYKLKWNASEWGNVTDLRFPVSMLWRPDVLVYNSADTAFDSTYPSNIIVYNTGDILWIPPGILRTSCKIDIRWFPFDDQSCYIKFGSWTYHGYALDLQPESPAGADQSEYMTNGEWLLLSTPVNRSVKYYDCCPEPYVDIKFFLNIRRRTLYYGFNLIIPSLLISMMTVLGFTLPPDAGEKITLEITILLSVCFFLSIVADMTPPTSEAVPLIGTFFTCCMVVVSASVVFTVVVLNLHYRTPDTHDMSPGCRDILLNWLPWMLMMTRPGHTFKPPPIVTYVVNACHSICGTCVKSDDAKESCATNEQAMRIIRNARYVQSGLDRPDMLQPEKLKQKQKGRSPPKDHTVIICPTLDATDEGSLERGQTKARKHKRRGRHHSRNRGAGGNHTEVPLLEVVDESPQNGTILEIISVNPPSPQPDPDNQGEPPKYSTAVCKSPKESFSDPQMRPSLVPQRRRVSSGNNSNSSSSASPPPIRHLMGRRLTLNVAEHRRKSVGLDVKMAACMAPILAHPTSVEPGVHALILMLQKIHQELQFVVTRMEKSDVDEDAINDWKFAAMVVDRVCLIVFTAFILASTCGIMFSAPNITI